MFRTFLRLALLGSATLMVAAPAGADAATSLPAVNATLRAGQPTSSSTTLDVTLPQRLDVGFVFDTTSDNASPLTVFKSVLSSTILPTLGSQVSDLQYAAASMQDHPYQTFGAAGDLPFRDAVLSTSSASTLQTGVNAWAAGDGTDAPEAQISALYHAITGAGLSWPGGSVAAASPTAGTFGALGLRSSAATVVVLVSHAPFHNAQTLASPVTAQNAYNFVAPDSVAAVDAFNARGTRFAGVVLGQAAPDDDGFDYLNAMVTGSADAHVAIPTNGTGMANAVVTAVRAATWTVEPVLSGCTGLTLASTPARQELAPGATASFAVQLTPTTAAPATITCTVQYRIGGVVAGEQPVTVAVVRDPAAPGGTFSVAEGAALSGSAATTDPDGRTLTYSATGLPAGATLDTATGALAWTPTFAQAGTYTVLVTAANALGGTATGPVTITVLDSAPPTLTLGAISTVNRRTGRAWLAATCRGGASSGDTCTVTGSLTIRQRIPHRSGLRTLTLGSVSGTVVSGRSGRLTLRINPRGMQLLAARRPVAALGSLVVTGKPGTRRLSKPVRLLLAPR